MPVTSVEPGKDQGGRNTSVVLACRVDGGGFHMKELTEYWAVSCPHDVVVMAGHQENFVYTPPDLYVKDWHCTLIGTIKVA